MGKEKREETKKGLEFTDALLRESVCGLVAFIFAGLVENS